MISMPEQPSGRGGGTGQGLDHRAGRQRWIDRWADGQLPLDDQRQLLAYCVAHPEVWRELALGLVSAQAWREALTDDRTPVMAAAREAGSAVTRSEGGTSRVSSWAAWFVAAAALLPAGWWLGYSAAERHGDLIGASSGDQGAIRSGGPIVDRGGAGEGSSTTSGAEPDESTRRKRPAGLGESLEGGSVRQVATPAQLSALAHWASPPDEWLDRAQRSGYDVSVKTDLWPARDGQGRAYWVPISQTQLRAPEIWNQ
ncbi:MAG: hypothetical protein U0795_25855 [Pirellulales bacterium]